MAITTAIANSFKQEILDGIHLAADTYKMALFTNAASLDKTTTAYSTTNEVATGGGYSAGGLTLSGRTNGISGDTAYLTFTNPAWANATITARGCMIYNSTRSNKCVAVYDFGSDIVSTNGTFTVVLPAAGLTAAIRIA
jgi:hypothetical protein